MLAQVVITQSNNLKLYGFAPYLLSECDRPFLSVGLRQRNPTPTERSLSTALPQKPDLPSALGWGKSVTECDRPLEIAATHIPHPPIDKQ